ncbi:TPA: acyltransferase family protein [Morganella morganii]
MNKNKFRFDINGLRAIAVLLVVIFHYDKNGITGGFIGVDVFFVISGYLMTGIIFRGLESKTLSIFKFYIARAKRIIPALLTVVVIILIFGYLFIEPMSYSFIGIHGLASLFFVSNVIYRNESGYFDVDAYDKYFLHTWSLSVEWQFYIIYPIILLLLSKIFSIKLLKRIILLSVVVLFIYGWYSSNRDSVSSYFMLQSRAWEMLLGGVAYLYPFKWSKPTKLSVYYVSLLVLVCSAFFINHKDLWPGYLAIIPTMATYLIISSSVDDRGILANKVLQYVGLISYSIYLVHWPILVINNQLDMNVGFVCYIIVTLILACFLYYLVERKRKFGITIIVVYFLATITCNHVAENGESKRVNLDFQKSRQDYRGWFEGHLGMPQSNDIQYFNGNESDFDYILIGDSHARHYFSYINNHGVKVASIALDGCTSTENYYSKYNKEMCESRYEMELNFIAKHKDKPIVISRYWPGLVYDHIKRVDGSYIGNVDFEKLMIDELDIFYQKSNHGQNFYIIGDTPGSKKVMFECLAKADLPINKITGIFDCNLTQARTHNQYNTALQEFASKYDNVKFIDTYKFLCNEKECTVIDNDIPVYTDTSHLSITGSEIVGSGVFSEIKK